MPAYRVMINGQNFPVEMDGRVAKYGFFTTRIVESPDPVAAVQTIRGTQRLRDLVRNEPGDPSVMVVTSWRPARGSRTESRALPGTRSGPGVGGSSGGGRRREGCLFARPSR